jgi:hypothetical protein
MSFARRLARLSVLLMASLAVVVVAGGCAAGDPTAAADGEPTLAALTIAPKSSRIGVNQPLAFHAHGRSAVGDSMMVAVDWTADGGTISPDGVFSSSRTGTFKVIGRGKGGRKPADTATVIVDPNGGSGAAVDTIFSETWESGSKSAWTDEGSASLHTIVSDPSLAHSGNRALRVTFPAGQEAGWLSHWFMPGYDSVYVRFWLRLDPAWVGNTKLVNLTGNRTDDMWSAAGMAGSCPTGSDFFSTGVVMPTSEIDAVPSLLRIYTYYPGMPTQSDGVTCYGSYGASAGATYSSSPPALSRGVWHEVEFWVKLNAVGQTNGAQRVWLDGQLIGDWPNLALRSSTVLMLNRVMLTFSHAGVGPASVQRQLYLDDLLILAARPAQ